MGSQGPDTGWRGPAFQLSCFRQRSQEKMGVGKGEGRAAEDKKTLNEDEVERGSWDNQCDFFLSCLGYAVGLGNVWRFPYLCYEHGGVTFLIAYVVCLLVSGLPLFFLELSLGQWAGKGPLKLFGRMAPASKGLGYGMLIISFLVVIYYNMIIAWTLFYTVAGLSAELPWQFCGNTTLTSPDCFQRDQELACFNASTTDTFWNKECTPVEEVCAHFNFSRVGERDESGRLTCFNGTQDVDLNNVYARVSPSEDYFKRTMLGLEEDTTWENVGGLRWQLVLSLAIAWLIVCLCLIKGVQSSGKVVYFTALFPYLVLVILLIRGATLDGAYDGILFYVYPTQEKLQGLLNINVWSAAATQIFYSLGPSFGGLITLASYNKFSNNCHRDAILVFVMTFVQYSPAYSASLLPGLEEKYVFPGGIQGLGIIMSFAPLMIIILGALYQLWKRNSQGKSNSFKAVTSPNEKWCSAVADKNKNRAGVSNVTYMKDDVAITNYKYEHGM